jgi:hypothetical protein
VGGNRKSVLSQRLEARYVCTNHSTTNKAIFSVKQNGRICMDLRVPEVHEELSAAICVEF